MKSRQPSAAMLFNQVIETRAGKARIIGRIQKDGREMLLCSQSREQYIEHYRSEPDFVVWRLLAVDINNGGEVSHVTAKNK